MILAAGAILQSGKYIIQAVLHQTDLGVTYQAYHAYLNQTVVLQTLNPDSDAAGQPFNLSELRQQFVQQARGLAKHPSNHRLRAIDLFEEDIEQQTLPFVVLSFLANQPPQKIGEWFAALPAPKSQIETAAIAAAGVEPTVKSAKSDAARSDASQAEKIGAKIAQAVQVSEPLPAVQPRSEAVTAAASIPAIPIAAGAASVTSRPHSSNSVRVYVQPQRRSSPNLFLLTALIAGAMGAGMGFALRMHPAPQSKTPFNLGNGLFTREQSFPSQGNWPIHETPQGLMPEPAANQPAYATEPALQYQPPIEPFPATEYAPLPADPVQPLPRSTAPQEPIENNPAPAATEPESPVRLPPASATRDLPLSPKPAPIAPADPAPLIPNPPAAAPPPPPAIDPPPAPESSTARPPRPKPVDQ